jgi:hypothetical protein
MRKDNTGAIEGFPLYLMIIIIITVVGIGIVLGLLSSVEPPKTIKTVSVTPQTLEVEDPDGDDVYTKQDFSVTIRVTDSSGDGVKSAVVTLDGCNVKDGGSRPYGKTDSDGKLTLSGLSCEVVGDDTGHITVNVEKSGMGKKAVEIVVIPV